MNGSSSTIEIMGYSDEITGDSDASVLIRYPCRCLKDDSNVQTHTGKPLLAYRPREGGSEELSGVFGGPPRLASSSAMRAFNAFTCASDSSMRSSRPAICAMSPSIRASSDATSWAPSLLGESISLCGIASVNQLAALGSTPQTRVTTPQRRE